MKTKRVLCAILGLILALVLLPAAAYADAQPTGIWVGGTEIVADSYYLSDNNGGILPAVNETDAKKYTVHYDGATGVLTLKDAVITKNYVDVPGLTAAVYTTRALTVNLIGKNMLRGADCPADNGRQSVGLCVAGALIITGNGSLTAAGGTTPTSSCGIFCNSEPGNGGISITGGTVIANGGAAGNSSYGINSNNESSTGRFSVSGGKLTANGGEVSGSYCISVGASADAVSITGGEVTAHGGKVFGTGVVMGLSYGLSAAGREDDRDSVNISGGKVTATGGEVANGTYCASYGLYGYDDTKVTGGTVTAAGGRVPNGKSYGLYGGNVTIEDGTVIADGGDTGGAGYSSNGVYGSNSVSIKGGKVTANAGNALDASVGYSNGVFGDTVSISGGEVNAGGGDVYYGLSYGVFANSQKGSDDSITISGGTVTAIAGAVSDSASKNGFSCGLFGNGIIAVSGGMVTVKGGTITYGNSHGAQANEISISRGTVNAGGGNAVNGFSCGMVGYRTLTMSGGTLTAYGDAGLSCSADSSDNGLFVGNAGEGSGLRCCVSDIPRETDWGMDKMRDEVYGAYTEHFSASSVYYSNPSVRISQISAISGRVLYAVGLPASDYLLYLNGVRATYVTGQDVGEYSTYVENGTYTVSAEKGTQIGSVSVTVDSGALSRIIVILGNASAPDIAVTPVAAFIQGGAPDDMTLTVGSAGSPPNGSGQFGSLEISSDNERFTTVDPANYSLRYGSIHIELSQPWLNSLTPGTYTLRVNLAGAFDGISPTTQFTVTTSPAAGDSAHPVLWLGIMLLAAAGLAAGGILRRRRQNG